MADSVEIARKGKEGGHKQADLRDPKYYINRELSMLEFQRRVLEEAYDETNPLLERAKFLGFVGLNLDEFYMVRVAGLKRQVEAGVVDLPPDGMTPAEQLAAIRKAGHELMSSALALLMSEILPKLDKAGIHVLSYDELNEKQIATIASYFNEVVFPVLTPLAVDPGHPFPHISNLSLNLAVMIRDQDGKELFARIKVPDTLPRLVPIKRSSGSVRRDGTVPHHHYFVWLEQVIAHNLDKLFPGMEIVESHPFRITRDADMEIQELEASDLLETMEQSMRQRRFGSVVRLTINEAMPVRVRETLVENLEMDRNDVYILDGPLGLSDVMQLYNIDRYDLKDPQFKPEVPAVWRHSGDENPFPLIRKEDILLHHPYDSFLPVVDFLLSAARDPNVLAIKQTLYRIGKNPPVVTALLEAVENGKQVAVLLELKARFDEESNIEWAKKLESAGVHVIYGLLGLKTHSKVALVIRKEGEGIRRYIHLATGNYNAVTALTYEDLGMFTSDDEMGADATDLFNYLTGFSAKRDYRKLLVAPINLRERFDVLIDREIAHQKKHGNGRLIFKVNHIVDPRMIQRLYKASQAGVKIDLIVRGICCMRPGIEGVSENIRITSIVGRYLEHSRLYYFYNNGKEEVYSGSADLMPRNIDRRVEVLFPIEDSQLIRHLRDNVLEIYLKDNIKARVMLPDGTYHKKQPEPKEPKLSAQDWFMERRKVDRSREHRS